MSSSTHHASRITPEGPSASSDLQMDLSETDPRSLPRAIDNTEELSYPLPIFQPRPKCPRQSTEHTLVNQDLCGRLNGKLKFQASHPNTSEGSNLSAFTARNVDVASADSHSTKADPGDGRFFPDRSLASSPPPDPYSRGLCPRIPVDGDRYCRKRTLPTDATLKLTRGPRPIVNKRRIPDGWREDIHPEGLPLYSTVVDARKRHIRVHTDLPLRLAENHSIIARALEMFSKLARECNELYDSDVEDSDIEACIVVSEKIPDEFGYYLVNHQSQTVFWLEDIEHERIEKMRLSALDSDILQLRLETLYWRHVTDFPCHCSLSSEVWEKLSPMILVGAVDQEYCDESTAPKDAATLARLETFWRQAKKKRDVDSARPTCNWICGRLWYDFVAARVVNYWGTDYARLERTTQIGDDPKPSEVAAPPLIEWLCLLFLWNEPAVTMKLLDEAWPGRVINQKPWRKMMATFSNEWEKIFVLSAIIFAGAMAFLAVPVQNSTGNGPAGSDPSMVTSFAFLCGILCCVFSIASLIAAVNLKRDFGGKITEDVHEAGSYLESLEGGVMGYLKWGICLSFPRALFQWAVISFCAGLVILAFQLHEQRTQFFWTEVAVTLALAVGVVAVRRLAPERIRPESIFRVRKKVQATKDTISTVARRATTMLSDQKTIQATKDTISTAARRATSMFSDRSRRGRKNIATSIEDGLELGPQTPKTPTPLIPPR